MRKGCREGSKLMLAVAIVCGCLAGCETSAGATAAGISGSVIAASAVDSSWKRASPDVLSPQGLGLTDARDMTRLQHKEKLFQSLHLTDQARVLMAKLEQVHCSFLYRASGVRAARER